MTKEQFIFEKLAREDECWHEWRRGYTHREGNGRQVLIHCTICGAVLSPKTARPDFTIWEGFGWMWERTVEKYPEFFVSDGRGIIIPDPDRPTEFREMHIGHLLINPIRLRDALADYFGWEGE